MGPLEWLAISSFQAVGHQVTLYSYDDTMRAPSGVKLASAHDIVPESAVFENPTRRGTYAAFSNIFRYRLLSRVNTTWVDSDVIALRPLPDREYLFGREDEDTFTGAVLGLPKASTLLQELIRRSDKIGQDVTYWGQLGPRLVSESVRDLGMQSVAQDPSTLFPVAGVDVWRLFVPSQLAWVLHKTRKACTVHLWNEVLRNAPRPVKESCPPAGSYMHSLYEYYDVRPPSGPPIPIYWFQTVWQARLQMAVFRAQVLRRRREWSNRRG